MDRLQIIDWRITDKCGMNCAFCYASEQVNRMTCEEAQEIVALLKKSSCKAVCISGGEPLTEGKFAIDIIKYIHDVKKQVFLSTNGTNYFEFRNEIEKYVDKLSLPLDGYDSVSSVIYGHRPEECFYNTIKILEFYKSYQKLNFKIKISTVLSKHNLNMDFFDNMYHLLCKYKNIISLWKLYEYIPQNVNEKLSSDMIIENNDFELFERKIEKLNYNDINFSFCSRKSRNSAYFIIKANGDVVLPIDNNDIAKEEYIGNLLIDSYEEVVEKWHNSVDLKSLATNNSGRFL